MPRYLLFFVVCTLVACGPGERDPGDITTDNGPNNTENNETPNNAENNVSPDMGSSNDPGDTGMDGDDMGGPTDMAMPNNMPINNLPTGEVCPYDDLAPFNGPCDPVGLGGCSGTDECHVAVRVVGPDATVSSICESPEESVLSEFADCADTPDERCEPGLTCVSFYGECRKLCYPDTAAGCDPGEFCRRPSATWEGLGFCDDTCNL